MRLMLCCSELGLGHVSRIIPLGKKLQEKGHELFCFSGGKAYHLLQKEFRNVYPCTPVAWYENASGIVASASLINILFPLPFFNHEKNRFETKNSTAMETVHRYYDLRKHIRQINPELVVADGDLHALRMASRWKFPAVYIANMIRPSYGFSAVLELELAKEQAISLYEHLEQQFSRMKIVYSGRGFHIHVFDPEAYALSTEQRCHLAQKVKEKGFQIDEWVTAGDMRLIRLPYSLHGLVSRVVVPVEKSELDRFDPIHDKRCLPSFLGSTATS